MRLPRLGVAAVALAGGLLTGALPADATAATAGTAAGPASGAAATSRHDLHLDFNGRAGAVPDLTSSGSAPVTTWMAAVDGGTIGWMKHRGAGRAARFEPFDDDPPIQLAVLAVRPDGDEDPFAPGGQPFTFGASFRLDRQSEGTDVDNGNNLLQRGLFSDAAQYKLQVDGERLSCRVSGAAGAVVTRAGSDLRPRRWHRAQCTRRGDTVVLRLVERTADGLVRHRWRSSGEIGRLRFPDSPPLAVGGKLTGSGDVVESSSDQFNGRVDDVFFRLLDQ